MRINKFILFVIIQKFRVFRIHVEKALDPRVKPEDDNFVFVLFAIPARRRRESIQSDDYFNFYDNAHNL